MLTTLNIGNKAVSTWDSMVLRAICVNSVYWLIEVFLYENTNYSIGIEIFELYVHYVF